MTATASTHLLRHFLAALAYRTQKAVRGAGAAAPAGAAGSSPRIVTDRT